MIQPADWTINIVHTHAHIRINGSVRAVRNWIA